MAIRASVETTIEPKANPLGRVSVALLTAVLSGCLLGLSAPPNGLWGLAFVALAPLLASALFARPTVILIQGLLCGLICGYVLLMSSLGYMIAYFVAIGLSAAIVGLFTRWSGRLDRLSDVLFIGAVGVVAEWLTALAELPTYIALAVSRDIPFIQLAGLTGVWGVSFVLWVCSAAVAGALVYRNITPALKWVGLGVLLIHLLGYLSTLPNPTAERSVRVAVIQPHYDNLSQLVQQAKQQGAELVIVPECSTLLFVIVEPGSTFVPNEFYFISRRPSFGSSQPSAHSSLHYDDLDAIALAQAFQVTLLAGHSHQGYNCASLVLPDGRVVGTHKKMFPFLGEQITRGHRAMPFESEWGRIGAVICYDTMFSHPVRQTVRAGAQIVTVPTNDPVASRYAYHHLHAAMASLRAAENRVPVLVAEWEALSTITDRYGRVRWQAPEGMQAVKTLEVPLARAGTVYTWLGDYFVVLCALGLLGAVHSRIRGRIL